VSALRAENRPDAERCGGRLFSENFDGTEA